MPDRAIRRGEFVARHAEQPVRAALADTRIVAIVGPRQSGKTTLARRIADGRPFITLDDDQFRRFARNDPVGFMRAQSTATVRPRDFKGLKRLREAAGDGFSCGIILHDGERVQQAASRLFAMPVKMLWTN